PPLYPLSLHDALPISFSHRTRMSQRKGRSLIHRFPLGFHFQDISRSTMQLQKRILLLALAAGLTGCGEDGELFGSTKQEGKLTIALTDAPVESAAKVVVTFNEIELLKADNERLTFGLRETGGGCEATDEAVA